MGDAVRQTWDKEEYRQKAKQRERKKQAELDIPEEYLTVAKARETGLELEESINKTVLISAKDEANRGFRCAACGLSYHDNLSYLDHLNSIQHLKTMGLSAKIRRSTVEEVKARILARKQKPVELDAKERIEQQKRLQEEERRLAKEKRKLAKELERTQFEDEDIGKIMGFGGFSTSKKQ